ncbi:response regulator PleD [Andreesenia angusta]|uniref:Response regulator PleD n=1 Tax=Andreesenia angusta TaxID=39480 RepID=A0A1S1V9V2_9FIRM|nr:GGDEF domain-containing protein [Andreesenia angusta]OHW63294.1 response regulator PleD [Andreesenia angusta]
MKSKYRRIGLIAVMEFFVVVISFYMGSVYHMIKAEGADSLNGPLASEFVPLLLGILIGLIGLGYMALVLVENRVHLHKKSVLDSQVSVDSLTSAYTKSAGIKDLGNSFELFKSGEGSPAVISIDLDNFKNVNDTYGHDVGDKVLKSVAEKIKSNVRGTDKLYRWGGDEFILVCGGMKRESVMSFCKGLILHISELEEELGAHFSGVTISAGVSYFSEEDRSYEDAIKRADEAMCDSKSKGKNQAIAKI